MRQDKTLKPVANFIVAENPLCEIKEHQGSDKMFYFTAYDCSDETPQLEKFVLKFGNTDSIFYLNLLDATKFKTAFNAAKQFSIDLKEGKEPIYAEVVVDEVDEEQKKETNDNKEKKAETKVEEKKEDKKTEDK